MNNKTTPKDFFLHAGATIALYVSVIALINLAFEIVNRLLPDQLSNYWSANSIVWPISMLVVLVPVLYILEWLIAKDITKIIEKKDIWVRRWRIYLTLFLTGATIVGDLVALINVYLNGEITSRFIWKIVVVLIICSAVFKYYFFSINDQMYWSKMVKKIVPWWGIILVLAAVIGGFIIAGSPAEQRAVRLDQQRVSDLTSIQWQVINYWQKKKMLPQTLSDLSDPISGYVVPTDPETGRSYEYSTRGLMGTRTTPSGLSFELCADFSTQSDSSGNNGYMGARNLPVTLVNQSWAHTKGHVCFSRMIDPALYPQVSK